MTDTHVLICPPTTVVWKETTFEWPGPADAPPIIEVNTAVAAAERAIPAETQGGVASAPGERAGAGSTETATVCSFSAVAAAAVARGSPNEKVRQLVRLEESRPF